MKKENMFIRQSGEYFETFLPDIHRASENTISAYANAFVLLFQFFHEKLNLPHHLVTYKHFTPANIDQYLLWLKNVRNYSDATIRQRVSAVTAFLKYASRREMSALNAYSAVSGAELPSVTRTAFPYFTLEEMGILLHLPDPKVYLGKRDLVVLSFLYDSAARADELCRIKVGDVRFGCPTKVRLHGKGDKTREIPVSDEVSNLLKFHIKDNCLDRRDCIECYLFSSQSNKQMTTSCVRSVVEKYVKQAKRQHSQLFQELHYSPHSYRHSKAVHMAEAGVDLIYIRNFLGHEFISSTEIYARIGQEAVSKALTNRKIPQLATDKIPEPHKPELTLPKFITNAR